VLKYQANFTSYIAYNIQQQTAAFKTAALRKPLHEVNVYIQLLLPVKQKLMRFSLFDV